LDGSNVLLLRDEDVKIIADLMMGGDGTNISDELNDMHLSAIAEAMNQMMGSAATSLSSMLNKKVDISPPVANQFDVNADILSDEMKKLAGEMLVKVSFNMKIGTLVNSEIMQMFPLSFAREMYECYKQVIANDSSGSESEPAPAAAPASPQAAPQPAPTAAPQPDPGYQQAPMTNVQPATFQNFAPMPSVPPPQNYDMIMDVPLEVTVELGRANKSIKEILDFAPGTIIELNKLAGEPVDVLVNGKLVAKGEVVVIEESFGIRITELVRQGL
jgi:flagellar motor switch protein FliN/FliY